MSNDFDRDDHVMIHDVIFNVCVIIDERGQDGYFGRTALLHPDQHPL